MWLQDKASLEPHQPGKAPWWTLQGRPEELTKTVGEIMDVKPKNELNEEKAEDVVKSEVKSGDVEKSENTVRSVVSTGRQRFGDTKLMPMYTLETSILVEFMK